MKIILLILVLFNNLLIGCTSDSQVQDINNKNVEATGKEAERMITDAYGRKVNIPEEINSIICLGSGALRQVSYLKSTDLLIGIEEIDKNNSVGVNRDYSYVHKDEFSKLPVIGQGGGTSYTAYPEEIIELNPDVIFSCYSPEALKQLEMELDIPIVSIRYISEGFVDDSFYESLKILSECLNKNERYEELVAYIDNIKTDLNDRTKDIEDFEKPSAYTGAVTFSGAHGFTGTYSDFGPFTAVNGINVADLDNFEGYYEADMESIVKWDPDVIFIDPGNLNLVEIEYEKNPNSFNILSAVKNKNIYTMPAYNNYSTNITYCLINGYHAGKVMFPSKFLDISTDEIGSEILLKFLGRDYFSEMEDNGLYYGEILLDNNE